MYNKKRGFTLIELMVAMGIIAVLVTLSILGIQIVQQSLRNTQRRDALNSINLAINSYQADEGIYPTTVNFNSSAKRAEIGGTSRTIPLDGPVLPSTTTTSSNTKYCYYTANGSTYQLGASLEGGGEIHLGNDTAKCTL